MRRIALFFLVVAVIATVSITQADPGSPFTITDVDSPDPVASGAQLLYTITMVNTGGSKATNVVLSDQLNGVGGIGVPPQLQITSTRGSCAQSTSLVTCSGGSIEGGGSWTVTIRGVVTAANGTTINNTASVTGTRSAQNFTSTTTASTLVSNGGGSTLPDLTISKTGPTSVVVSSPITYTLTVNNSGTANATGVKVVDTVPAGLTGLSASGTSLFTCGIVAQTVTCTGGAVNQGSNATITINATAPPTTGTITNTASVDPDNTIPESDELNNSSALVDTQVVSSAASGPLTINKTDNPAEIPGAGPDPVTPGALETYKILVTNTGTTRADDVTIVDGTQGLQAATIQASFVVTNGTIGNGGGCSVAAPQAKCLARTLNPGGTILMTVSGTVIASAGSTIINTATVTGNVKNMGVSATDTELTTVKPGIDLTVTKADSPDPVCARSWPGVSPVPLVCRGGLTYTFVVGNSGINPATGVTIRDPLMAGLLLDSYSAPAFSGGCAVDASNVFTCTGGAIGPESTATVTIVLVAPSVVGTITNTVTVDPNNAIFEADETNNTATATTQVVTGIDLTVSKTDAIDPIATSGTETYTIKVNNLGTQDASGIRLRDTLPAGTIFRDVVSDHGFTCANAAGVVECVGGAIKGTASNNYPPLGGSPANPPDTAIITIRIFAQPFAGTMHNEVRVDPLNEIAEADETNNIATQDTVVGSFPTGHGAFNQLTINKHQVSPDKTNTARNAIVTYAIDVGNTGTDTAVGVTVRDFLPAGSRYIEATSAIADKFLCSQVGGYINCAGGQIASGGMATITLTMFAPDTPGTYINQAIVDPDNTIAEGDELDNQSNETTIVTNGGNGAFNDLTVSFQPAPASTGTTTPGGAMTYKLDVFNLGTNVALNVAVRDILPAGVTFVSAADSSPGAGAFTCTQAAGVIDCTGATIPGTVPGPAGSRTIVINVTAPNQNGLLTDQAIADPNNAIPEGDETNNTATFPTSVQSVINLNITKNGPKESSQSSPGEYDIVMTNQPAGTGQTAFHVRMQDPFPVGLIPLAVDTGEGNNWQCAVSQNPINLLDCVGDLEPNKPVTIKFFVFMTAESGKSLDNEACFVPNPDVPPGFPSTIEEYSPPGTSDNCSTASTVINPPPTSPDLFVTKSAEPGLVGPGADLTYTILVANNGSAKATSPLTLTDTLPTSSVTFVDANGTNGWTCTGTGPVICHDAAGVGLDVGQSVTITIHVKVKDTVTLPFVNVAEAAPATADAPAVAETSLLNNKATVKTSVNGSGTDLAITTIVDSPDPVAPGQALKYTVIAVNGGTADQTGVHIRINLPTAGVGPALADGSNGFNCGPDPAVANALDCVGDLPGGGNTVITVGFSVLMGPGLPPDITLTATIDPDNLIPEIDEGNNTQSETTTISGSVCTSCIDLVSSQLVPSPDPVNNGGTLVVKYQIVNVGDTSTALTPTQNLLSLNSTVDGGFGGLSSATVTSSDPVNHPCSSFTIFGFNFVTCTGNLAGGEGLTVTLTLNGVSGSSVLVTGTADPNGHVTELTKSNNILTETIKINP